VRLSLGLTLTHTGHVLAANLLPFLVFGFLVRAPLFLRAWGRARGWWGSTGDFLGFELDGVGLLGIFLGGVLLRCFVISGADATLSRRRGKAASALRGLRFAPSVLGVSLFVGGLAWACVFFASFVAAQFAAIGPSFRLLYIPIMLFAGLIALMVVAAYFASAPVVVAEHLLPTEAMARSAWLTKGSLWSVLLLVVPILGIRFGGWILLVPWNHDPFDGLLSSGATLGLMHLVGMGLDLLQAVMATVVYHDLRVAKEGGTTRDVVEVFR